MQGKSGEFGLASFTPAEGSKPIQTPYGSLQLAAGQGSQQQYGSLASAMMGGESEDEDDDDDDDEDGLKKRKRRAPGSTSSAGSKPGSSSGNKRTGGQPGSAGGASQNLKLQGGASAGERDAHTGRRKIRIEFIEDDSRRHITFSKRKAGIMKKAYELATLTGTQVLLLIVSQTGLVYTFTTPKLSPVVQQAAGRELIQSCLSAPEPGEAAAAGYDSLTGDDAEGSGMPQPIAPRSEHGTSSTDAHAPHASHAAALAQQHQQQQQHPQQHQQQHMHGSLQHGYASTSRGGANDDDNNTYAAAFGDPRHSALLNMGHMQQQGNISLANLPPHLQGLSAYGYNPMAGAHGGGMGMGMSMPTSQPQLVGHDHAVPYANYGGM